MRRHDRASLEQLTHATGDETLSSMRPRAMNPPVERGDCAAQRIERHRGNKVGQIEQHRGPRKRKTSDRRDRLRPVDHREAFFRLEDDGLDADLPQSLFRRHPGPAQPNFAVPHHRCRQLGERCEIARGSHRALRRNQRNAIFREHTEKRFDRTDANSGVSLRERVRPQQHHRPHHLGAVRLTRPCAM